MHFKILTTHQNTGEQCSLCPPHKIQKIYGKVTFYALIQTEEEKKYLMTFYGDYRSNPGIFSEPAKIDAVVREIETCLQQTLTS